MKRVSLLLLSLMMIHFPMNVSADSEIGLYAEEYQEIMGWGGFPWYARTYQGTQDAPPISRAGVPEAIIRDSGMTIYRIEYLPRFYNEADDGSIVGGYIDDVLQTVEKARDLGVTEYMVSIWTPPYAMKSVKTATSGGNGGFVVQDGVRYESSLLEDREDDYVQYICDVTNYIKGKGLPVPKYISVQNEPNHVVDYHSAATTPEQYLRLIKKLRKALDTNNLTEVKLIAGEGNFLDNNASLFSKNYQSVHLDDELNDCIDVLATHAYSSNSYYWPISVFARDSLATFDKPIMQAEWCQDDDRTNLSSDNDYAMQAARRFSKDMVEMGYNYWLWWNMWHHNTATTAMVNGNSGGEITKNRQYGILSTIWKNAPPGSRVKKLYSSDNDIKGGGALHIELAGFANHQDNKTVLLVTNPTASIKNNVNFNYIPGSVAEIYQCDPNNSFRQLSNAAITAGQFQLNLPAESVTVVVTNSAALGSGDAKPSAAPALPAPDVDVNRYTVDTVYAGHATPTIDGDLADFGETSYAIQKLISGSVDGEAKFSARYDDSKLYIGVKVEDSSVSTNDAVRIFIDANNNRSHNFDSDDFRFTINASTGAITASASPASGVLGQCSAASKALDDGYSVEFAVPWNALGVDLYSADTIGFDIGVDGAGVSSSGNVLWNGATASNSDTRLYGKCKLVGNTQRQFGDITLFDDTYQNGTTVSATSNISPAIDSTNPQQGSGSIAFNVTNNSSQSAKLLLGTPLAVRKMDRADIAVEFWVKSADVFNLRLGVGSGQDAAALSSYSMLRGSTGGNTWKKVTVPLSRFDSTGITASGKYGFIDWSDIRHIEFKCDNYSGKTFYVDQVKIVAINTPVAPASSLQVAAEGEDSAEISWVSAPGTAKNVLYRNERQVAELDASVSSFVDQGLVENAKYLYYTISFDAAGNFSSKSAPVLHEFIPGEEQAVIRNVALAPGATVIAWSAQQVDQSNNNAAAKVNDGIIQDGDAGNRWAAQGYPQWVEIDLGADKEIYNSVLHCFGNRRYRFTIEAKPDGGVYTTVVNRTSNATYAPIRDTFEATTARYIKLTVTGEMGSAPWVSILELEVFGIDLNKPPSAEYRVDSVTISGGVARANFSNTTGSTAPVMMVCAVYDDENNLVNCKVERRTVASTDYIELAVDASAHQAKAFIWENGIKPLSVFGMSD